MKLILGCANFHQSYGVKHNSQVPWDEVIKILDVAIENRIDLLDTSTAYIDKSYEAVKIIKRVGCISDYWHYKDCIELAHGFDMINNMYDGVSVDTPEEALKAIKMGMGFIQLPYNVFDHDIMDTNFFKLAKKRKTRIIARSVFLQGLLLMDDPPIGKEYIKQFDDIVKPYAISRKEAALLFTYGNPFIDHVVVGVDTAGQLQELVDLTRYELPFSLVNKILDLKVPEKIKYPWLWEIK